MVTIIFSFFPTLKKKLNIILENFFSSNFWPSYIFYTITLVFCYTVSSLHFIIGIFFPEYNFANCYAETLEMFHQDAGDCFDPVYNLALLDVYSDIIINNLTSAADVNVSLKCRYV